MKTITTDKMTIGLVEVQHVANRFKVFNDEKPYLSFFIGTETSRIYLQSGNYTFLSATRDLTEKVAARIVDYDNDSNYKDYTLIRSTYHLRFATSSLASLLLANDIDPSRNYAILEIKK